MRCFYRLVPFSWIDWARVWWDLRDLAIAGGTGKSEQPTFIMANDVIVLSLTRRGENAHIWSSVKLKNPGLHAIQMAILGDYDSKDDTLVIMRNGVLTDIGRHFAPHIKRMIAQVCAQAKAVRAKQKKAKLEEQQRNYKQRKKNIEELLKAANCKRSKAPETGSID